MSAFVMFCCLHIPNFPIAAALRAEPELQGHAVAISEGQPPLEKIIAVNENAKALGIAPEMTKAQAELCSAIALRPRSPLQESSAHAALLDCAQSFSPCVEDSACDTVLLDLAGMESLFGPLPKIARAISERSIALGLIANIAVAVNPDAAMVAARGFSGITVICSGKESEQLGRLPVEVLFVRRFGGTIPTQRKARWVGHPPFPEDQDCSGRLLETFERWGIRNLRALAALPEVALSERLGQEGLHLQKLARGSATRTLVPVETPPVFEEAIELEHPIVLLEPLAFLLNRMLEQLCARLGSRALATQELRLTLELSNLTGVEDEIDNFGIPSESDELEEPRSFAPPDSRGRLSLHDSRQMMFERTLSLPLPMLDAKVFLKLLQIDLNAHPPGAPIVKIHLAAGPARPRSAQGGLFLPPSPEPEKLGLTLARIAGIVGEQKVGAIELLDTHHPEGFRMRRFVAEIARKAPQKKSPEAEAASAVTALRRFQPPLRANITLENGQPVRLLCPKKKEVQGEVLWKAGPWRFSGDWWERDAWSRDEWDLAVRNGEAVAFYRLVHDLLGGGWFIEGTYD